ncbi:uncharacterized protein EI90DRAFT_3297787 [Cantharellus anzutake]|uniref:uncharacterized protein n=1 Tax=Cantharellus anzutake TaxID=1750568 RepID=UPI0019060F0A|nr:uncharacterized protein EI90DRAFT_3297787 [Cantharellus anzutake]KAF8307316.1 hypothetical protein EI90DRAFT_3297787 [Cantharellus anzutake]
MVLSLHLVNSPNLKSLWIHMPTASRNWESDDSDEQGLHVLKSIAAFVDRTSEISSLRTLHRRRKVTNLHLTEVLRAVPNLHTLELFDITVGDDVLKSPSTNSICNIKPPFRGTLGAYINIRYRQQAYPARFGLSSPNIVCAVAPEDLSITPSSQACADYESFGEIASDPKKGRFPLTLELGLPPVISPKEEFKALEPFCRSSVIRERCCGLRRKFRWRQI